MRSIAPIVLRPWTLPLIVVALIAPAIAAFLLVGPELALAAGALTVSAVVAIAARARYEEEIEVARPPDARYRLLIVTTSPIEDPRVIERVAAIAAEGDALGTSGGEPELLVLAPVQPSRLERWATDVQGARDAARRALVVSIASLTGAGLDVSGKVGDADPVQAIEDELHTFAAREVVLLDGPGIGPEQVQEIRRRLDRPVRELQPAR